jgi:hypothetical protein
MEHDNRGVLASRREVAIEYRGQMGIMALIACAGVLVWVGRRTGLPWREAILLAAVFWGTLLTLITETLSLFHSITPGWLIACWLAATATVVAIGACLPSQFRSYAQFSARGAGSVEVWMLSVAVLLAILLAFIGAFSAPSNTDLTIPLGGGVTILMKSSAPTAPASSAR